jgi:small subunit ribosomal protein S6
MISDMKPERSVETEAQSRHKTHLNNQNFLLPSLLTLGMLPYLCRPVAKAADKQFFLIKYRVMNNYELMVIFTPVLSDDDFKAEQKKIANLVTANGGTVVAENPWGLKSLAFPIQKKTTGLYWVLEYIAPSDFNEKLKIQLLRDEAVLRHLCTSLDKYAVEYNAKKRSGVTSGTEKTVEA